ncbi:hypothetical protein CYMTET_48955 [Cymbomonas tetramitiformis]|uniref:TOG domain-containing protein n=1 Tax=Cymbomonas tetramitiformis TaxID=36881 RepID=A0AAE0EUM0_9CHLO|nr:hypothetical protein CYMTET_48955 [Cymbomonas tetramitiformis]
MKRQADIRVIPSDNKTGKITEASSPGNAKEACVPKKLEPASRKENVEPSKLSGGSPVGGQDPLWRNQEKQPSAKEIAAAKAARIRLGLEEPDGTESAEPASDENAKLPDGEEPTVTYEPEYLPTDQLTPVDDAAAEIKTLAENLGSSDWVTACEALQMARRLTVHHQELVQKDLQTLLPLVTKCVKNLRSSVCKSGILCITDMVSVFSEQLAELLKAGNPSLLLILLQKAATDKKFVMEEARRTLATIAKVFNSSLTMSLFVPIASTHKSPKVRAEAATVTSIAVTSMSQVDSGAGLLDQMAPLLKLTGTLISDRQPEARSAARTIAVALCSAHGSSIPAAEDKKPAWEKACKAAMSTSAATAVLKAT